MVALFVGIPQRLNLKLRCLADVNDSFSGMTRKLFMMAVLKQVYLV
jgi:hypothetical protein